MSKRLGLTLIIICALTWSIAPLMAKFVLASVSSFTLVGITYIIAAISIFVLSVATERKRLFEVIKSLRVLIILSGMVLGVQFSLFTWGLKLTTAVAAQILSQTEVVFFVIWGFVFFHEKVTKKKVLGIIFAAAGVFAISWNGEDLSILVGTQFFLGNMIILLSAFMFSIYMAFQKRLSDKGTSISSLFPIFFIASLLTLPLVPQKELLDIDPYILGIICLIGVLMALSYCFLSRSLKYILTSTVSVMLLTSPIMTFVIVAIGRSLYIPFFEGELLTAYILLGGAAILAGAFIVITEEKGS